MIAVDTNILVYAHRSDSAWHVPAHQVVSALAEGSSPWAIPWPCVYEFLAVVTHPRIYDPPTSLQDALTQVGHWLESPSLVLLSEPPGFLATLASTLRSSAVVGPAIHDGRIAALCLSHGVSVLYTADRDFSRFPLLKTRNPLPSRSP